MVSRRSCCEPRRRDLREVESWHRNDDAAITVARVDQGNFGRGLSVSTVVVAPLMISVPRQAREPLGLMRIDTDQAVEVGALTVVMEQDHSGERRGQGHQG